MIEACRRPYSTTLFASRFRRQKFQKLEAWAWWNPVVGQARWLEGQPWRKGSQFFVELVRPKVVEFNPFITASEPPNRICWIVKVKGVTGQHSFSFDAQPDSTTLLKTWETCPASPPCSSVKV